MDIVKIPESVESKLRIVFEKVKKNLRIWSSNNVIRHLSVFRNRRGKKISLQFSLFSTLNFTPKRAPIMYIFF